MMRLAEVGEGIWTLSEVLSPDECYDLVARGEALGFEPVSVRMAEGPVMLPGARNNDRAVFRDRDLAALLWKQVEALVPAEIEGCRALGLHEEFKFYRYSPGQRFKRHRDGYVETASGARSRLSFLIYLSEGCEGGETAFSLGPTASADEAIRVTPAAGTALLFRHELWHEGTPVLSGRKYVLRTDVLYNAQPTVPAA